MKDLLRYHVWGTSRTDVHPVPARIKQAKIRQKIVNGRGYVSTAKQIKYLSKWYRVYQTYNGPTGLALMSPERIIVVDGVTYYLGEEKK
jgi:hypothetical protein